MTLSVRATLAGGPFVVDVAFEARPGVTVLFGPSAAGKTLTLQAVAGLSAPRAGSIVFAGKTFSQAGEAGVPAAQRGVGYAPQDGALWPHRRVSAHVLPFASPARAGELRTALGLTALWAKLPARLSGGERQRVALARALARESRLLLFDEPLTALDRAARAQLGAFVVAEIARLEAVALWVTHDVEEAQRLAQQLVVFENTGTAMTAREAPLSRLTPAAAER